MASELLKNRALIQRLKEPKLPTVDFSLSTASFESTLPEPKPQELLDIQENVRIQRQQDTMNKVRPFLMDESVDFIERQNFSTAGLVKTLLKKIQPYAGADKIGLPTKKLDRTPEKNFMKAFIDFMNKKHGGNFSAAARAIGQDRNKIKGIFDRVRLSETGTRAGADVGKGGKLQTTIPEPKKKILYKDATTAVKADQKFLKDKIKNYNKKKFYNAKDLGNILGLDFSSKQVADKFTADLKRFNVKSKLATGVEGGPKKYELGDVVNKITKGYKKKLVEGQRKSSSERLGVESRLDPELKKFLDNFKKTTREISKEEDIFIPNAVEDVGHSLSIEITDKYPKLTKNSNINKINTLTFQDPLINKDILQKTGYESKHDALLEKLNKLVGKEIGPKEIEELKLVKSQMNTLHNKVLTDVKKLAEKNTYLKGQENRIPKIDINIPKQGQIFKSEDLFVDMSKVNPAFKVGLVEEINPNARFFKDLTKEQKEVYKRNVLDQTKFNLDKFYTKTGFPKEQVDELKDSLEFGTASKLGIGTVGTLGLGSTAAAADEPGLEDADAFLTKTEAGAGLAAAPLATKKGRSIYGKAAKGLLKTLSAIDAPAIAAPLTGYFGYQLGKDISAGEKTDVTGADLLLAPAFTNLAASELGLLNPARQGIGSYLLRAGLTPQASSRILPMISKGSTFALPAVETAIRLYNARKDLEEAREEYGMEDTVDTLLGEAPKEYYEKIMSELPEVDREGAMYGGRMSFAEGDEPPDPKRRLILKGMGILGLLPFGVGKLFKSTKPVVEKLANTTTKMPDWFPDFVDRFIGRSVGKKVDADLMEYKSTELPGVTLTKGDDGQIVVEGKNAYDEPYEIVYRPPGYELVDETTGKAVKTPGEFIASDTQFRRTGPEMDDYDVDGVVVNDVDDILGGNATELEGFATGTGKSKYTRGQKEIDMADAQGTRADVDEGPDIDMSDYED